MKKIKKVKGIAIIAAIMIVVAFIGVMSSFNKKTKMENLLKAYKEDSKLDYELGVIAKEIYEFEQKAAEILEKSLQNFAIF